MQILAIPTPVLHHGSDLGLEIMKNTRLEKGDIVVISSKVVATVEQSALSLSTFTPSAKALALSATCNQDPRFTEFVLQETKRMNGCVVGVSPHVLLTSLKPSGMTCGRILCPNAGADLSNVEEHSVIGWPHDPVVSAQKLRRVLGTPVIISDSCCVIGRRGVIAYALVCAGVDPQRSEIGKKDLFGKTMRLTEEAVADQLATAANAVMGNSAQSIPAAVIRNAGIPSSDFLGWVDGMSMEEDLFQGILKA